MQHRTLPVSYRLLIHCTAHLQNMHPLIIQSMYMISIHMFSLSAAMLHIRIISSQIIARQLQCTPFRSCRPCLHSLSSILSTAFLLYLCRPFFPTQISYGILFWSVTKVAEINSLSWRVCIKIKRTGTMSHVARCYLLAIRYCALRQLSWKRGRGKGVSRKSLYGSK